MARQAEACDAGHVRFVVYGAGAVGGVVGGRLIQHGHEVALISRGAHGASIARNGLRLTSPEGSTVLRPSLVVGRPEAVDWRPDDVVLLAVKSQHTTGAVSELARWAPSSVAVACLQNGVANEPTVLRWFPRVYGVSVMCPAGHLEPGTVVATSSPTTALLDVGRYPGGEDETVAAISRSFNNSSMDSITRSDIMRWKYSKLVLMNLSNALDALCGPEARNGALSRSLRHEGIAVLRAAGIDFASEEEDRRRRGSLLNPQPVPGQPRGGSSSWQSLARRAGSIETDYLNGEIVRLGRLHRTPTPVNEHVQWLTNQAACDQRPPGSFTETQILDLMDAAPCNRWPGWRGAFPHP
jgi:2-dehydropantoate 2-reductase